MGHRILILGGTLEARRLAAHLASRVQADITLSLAGRTQNPMEQPVPVRVGGFGGAAGLAQYLSETQTALLIDATHPYAARISENAATACSEAQVDIIALRRPHWDRIEGDRWTVVDTIPDAVGALGTGPRRVFLAFGRQELAPFEAAPQHAYLVRSVDPVIPPLAVPTAHYITDRGPFDVETERRLLADNRIDAIVAKNSGGSASYGKIAAARDLGIEVLLVARPRLPDVPTVTGVDEAVRAVDHWLATREKRGV